MARRHFVAAAAFWLVAALATVPLLSSCSPRLGWGLVLWAAPDGSLPAGSVVPVYIKSNIQKVYVVGVPATKGRKAAKIELPLWQLELYPSHRKAEARAKAMGANISLYMIAARDGLPLRDKPSNTGRRVYRLREGQSVKVLDKVEGDIVTTGGTALPGSWYQVLTEDGTRGYVFSYALRLYDESKEGPPVIAATQPALSGRVDLIFSRAWRPVYFQEMLDDKRIDLDYFTLRFGLFTDAIRRQVRIELPAASQVFNYSGISETDGVYSFDGTPLRIRIESDRRMVCSWSGDDSFFKADGSASAPNPAPAPAGQSAAAAAPAPGTAMAPAAAPGTPAAPGAAAAATATAVAPAAVAPAAAGQSPQQNDLASAADSVVEGYNTTGSAGSATFVVLGADALEAIRLETLRQQKLLSAFVDEVGGSWTLQNGLSGGKSRLVIHKNGRFQWSGRGDSVAALVPPDAGEGGDVAFRLFVDTPLSGTWTGAFSLRFDPGDSGSYRPAWIDFLYRRSPAGLVLAPASTAPGSIDVLAADARTEPLILQPATD